MNVLNGPRHLKKSGQSLQHALNQACSGGPRTNRRSYTRITCEIGGQACTSNFGQRSIMLPRRWEKLSGSEVVIIIINANLVLTIGKLLVRKFSHKYTLRAFKSEDSELEPNPCWRSTARGPSLAYVERRQSRMQAAIEHRPSVERKYDASVLIGYLYVRVRRRKYSEGIGLSRGNRWDCSRGASKGCFLESQSAMTTYKLPVVLTSTPLGASCGPSGWTSI